MTLDLVRISKFLSLVLRHRAADFGLAPDAAGYVPLDAVVALVERELRLPDGRAVIAAVMAGDGQQRFELQGDQLRALRALARHARAGRLSARGAAPAALSWNAGAGAGGHSPRRAARHAPPVRPSLD